MTFKSFDLKQNFRKYQKLQKPVEKWLIRLKNALYIIKV
jgi:hypothetical protein